jgi:mutator protein MutT
MHPLLKYEYCPMCGSHHFVENSEKSRKCENCGFELFMNPSAANVAFIMNKKGELLVERRKQEPAKGTLDLPGGFADPGETAEEGVCREVLEETGLKVTSARYIFSQPNIYRFSGVDIPTLDMFFICEVEDESKLQAADDAAECMWVKIDDIHTEQFGLRSVRWGLIKFMESLKNNG